MLEGKPKAMEGSRQVRSSEIVIMSRSKLADQGMPWPGQGFLATLTSRVWSGL